MKVLPLGHEQIVKMTSHNQEVYYYLLYIWGIQW